MLKKNPPPWSEEQTHVIKALKKDTQSLPALQIPSNGKRILQTDASDQFWGAILLEEDNQKKRRICAHASGKFSDAECHYHSTFKEILAVKYGIKKFEFHLVGYRFKVIMDCS